MKVSPENAASLAAMLRRRAELHPDRRATVFLSDEEGVELNVTYGQLDREARKIAALLQESVAKNERAVLLYPPGPGFFFAFLGCLYSGVLAVPAYPPNRPRDTRHATFQRFLAILKNSSASAILCTEQIFARLRPFASEFDAAKNARWIATDNLEDPLADRWQPHEPDSEDFAFLQYTSGSTASPRGVMLTHGNLMANERMMKIAFEHGEDTVLVGWLPFYHDMGLIGNFFQPLYNGGFAVKIPPATFLRKPLRWLDAISRYRATISGSPNFAYELCAEKITAAEKASLDLSSWDLAVVSAEPIRARSLEKFYEAFRGCGFRKSAFFPAFGLAEGTLMSTGIPKHREPIITAFDRDGLEQHEVLRASSGARENVLVGCGQALEGLDIRIVDPETRRDSAPNTIGEIWMRGPSIARGYWNDEENTKRYFGAEVEETPSSASDSAAPPPTYLRTGDLGFFFEDELYVTGRLKDLIIINGYNIFPQDVESTAGRADHRLVPDAGAAFALDLDEGESLVVVQEVHRRFRPEEGPGILAAVRRAVTEQHGTPPYAVVLIRIGTLPKTSSGKIRRSGCRDMYLRGELKIMAEWNRTEEGITAVAENPATFDSAAARELSFWIRDRIALHLKYDPATISLERPFADIGLDSVAAAQLMGELEAHLGTSLSETLPFEFGNISALARGILSSGSASPAEDDTGRAAVEPAGKPAAVHSVALNRQPGPGPKAGENSELGDILAELDALPPEEARQLKESLRNGSDPA